ncbi:MAG: hypothetical protein FJY76_03070 [Candidatus Aenigmarchaeota archaeon]|nr:hypothetical protein [Candidatus Aenigmarchaeota archaeon]
MVKIEVLIRGGRLSRISELEKQRYVNFFAQSYLENFEHSGFVMGRFPRWSIISGYYAMHDITKLLLAKEFGLKVEYKVHATTIKAIRELVRNREILRLIERGYQEFISLANDLAEAKKERVKAQYYTGTGFMRKHYAESASEFSRDVVIPYMEKIRKLLGD